ncbi:MAG TPA: tetratricopeptide repeat protein [Bacteroidales bacterium]|nr:tetratricopeptide repeat protein [Bacteroidales bacterium]
MPFNEGSDNMRSWKIAGFTATLIFVAAFPVYIARMALDKSKSQAEEGAQFVGRNTCIECHKKENDLWLGSHHDLAMDIANDTTVLGDFSNYEFRHKGKTHRMFMKDGRFFINTEGPGGKFEDFPVTYTFGYTPLQQYLVPFEGGRLQCLPIAWDTERGRWFHLGDTVYAGQDAGPDNWLYWTNQAQNWNGMCADCHSTNLKKNYDPETGTFNTTWSEIDVSCEACHGPASEHIIWANLPEGSRPADVNTGLIVRTRDLNNKELLDVCARCHSRRSIMGDYENDNSDLLNYMIPQLITQPIYHADGQILDEDYEYGSFTQSKMFEKLVKCSDCHDSHSVRTKEPDNQLCLQCHRPDIYDTPRHHFHKPDPGTGEGRLINRGEPDYVEGSGAQCVNCHMVGRYYMGNDYRRDHSFRIPSPALTLSIGTPNACNDCHKDKTTAWSQSFMKKWYGEKTRPHYGETFAAARQGDRSVISELILYARNELFPLMVRATAVHFLGDLNTSESNLAVEKALSDPASLVRHTAIMSYNPTDALSYERLMMPLLNDPVRAIRSEAGIRLSEVPENQLSVAARKARKSALEEYRNIHLYNSDFPGGRYNLGIMYANAGELEMAAQSYRDALKIDGLFYMAKVNLAMVYTQQRKNDEAEKLLREVLVENPEIADINYSLALLLAERGRYDESRKFFLKAAAMMPQRPRILYNLGLLENSLGNTAAAEENLLKALNREPDNYDFLYAITTFYLEHKQNTKALPYARQIAEKFPQNPAGNQLLEAAKK